MLEWMRRRLVGDESSAAGVQQADDRDTGEDAYESEEEIEREIGPTGQTRIKADGI
jgi:hypothetical protein